MTSQFCVPAYLCGSMNETQLETESSNSGEDFVGVSNKGGAVQTYHGPNITEMISGSVIFVIFIFVRRFSRLDAHYVIANCCSSQCQIH